MQQALSLACEAGNILLENGAEISRVEDSMNSIADGLGAKDHSFFILSNGIIIAIISSKSLINKLKRQRPKTA